MKTEKFQRKPFIVECVQVTQENLEEVAKWCNGAVTSTDPVVAEQLKKTPQTWIQVETQQPMNDRQKQAFVGDWLLYANRGFKIYTPKAFERTFEPVFQGERPARIHMDNKPKPSAPRKVVVEDHEGHKTVIDGRVLPEGTERIVRSAPVEHVMVQQKGTDNTATVPLGEVDAQVQNVIDKLAGFGLQVIPMAEAADCENPAPAHPVAVEDSSTVFQHPHPLDQICYKVGCTTDRYVDGVHAFSDQTVKADEGGFIRIDVEA